MANSTKSIKIGSFNMSFAGDAGLDPRRAGVFESEGAFHLSNPDIDSNPRAFWLNAAKVVEAFIAEPNFGALGLQEMNQSASGSNTGTDAIEQIIANRGNVRGKAEQVVAGPVKTSLMILWNSDIMGEFEKSYSADLTYDHTEVPKPDGTFIKQTGRPIVMVMTTGGYLLINVHGPNVADASKATMRDFKEAIKMHVSTFTSGSAVGKGKVYLMGDLNDRFDAVQAIELDIGGTSHMLTYSGKAPYSCCHNWDSSCSDARFTPIVPTGRGIAGNPIGTCSVPKDADGKPYALAGPGQRYVMGEEGYIRNYRYTGDKVFGENPASDIQLYIQNADRLVSSESDHEPVAADFFAPSQSGGKRHNRSKTHRKRNMKRRYSRRR